MSLSFAGQSLGTNNINKLFMSVEINSLSTTASIINTLFSQSSKHNSKLQASTISKHTMQFFKVLTFSALAAMATAAALPAPEAAPAPVPVAAPVAEPGFGRLRHNEKNM